MTMAKIWKNRRRLPTRPTSVIDNTTKHTSDSEYRALIRMVGQANRRLKEVKGQLGSYGWAGEKLKSRLNRAVLKNVSLTSKGVRIKPSMKKSERNAVMQALSNFLTSRTSTVKGVKSVMKRQQEGIRRALMTDNKNITMEESRVLYSFFGDRDFSYTTSYIDESELFALMEDSKEHNDSKQQFVNRILNYITSGQDEDMKRALGNIYDKYVRTW